MGFLKKHMKMTPEKAFSRHAQCMQKQDGNRHILLAQLPYNGEVSANERLNALMDGMRNHGYEIITVRPHIDMRMHMFTTIIYK